MVGTNSESFKREREMRLSGYIAGLLLWLCSTALSATEITIAENGRSRCAVVVAEDATLPEQHAAIELVYFLEQIMEAEIPLVHEAQEDTANLFVGSKAAKTVSPYFSNKNMESDELVLRTVGNDLILAGGEPRGTLYAVYTFLENVAGCRWWAPDASQIPKNRNVDGWVNSSCCCRGCSRW